MFKTNGSLYYYDKNIRDTQWLLLNIVDNSIIEYYQYLIKKEFWLPIVQKPKHGAHISVIRGEYINIENFDNFWKLYHSEIVDIEYSNKIENNGEHFWLPIYSKRLEYIRSELGLKPLPEYNLHLTICRLTEDYKNIRIF